MISQRRLKQLVTPFLPEAVKAPLRARLFGYRRAGVHLDVEFGADTVTIDRRIRLKYRDADASSLEYHLRENGESIEEIASFLECASGARRFFDVGAARGLFSHLFCLLGEGRHAVAFEPSPSLIRAAAELAALNHVDANIEWQACAVGREAGETGIIVDSGGYTSVAGAEAAQMNVPLTSLDREVARLGWAPGLVKIDVEGFEDEVLTGARELLASHGPTLCLELHLDLLERRGIPPARVVAELESFGYRFRSCAGAPLSGAQVAGSMNALLRIVAQR